MPRKRLFHRTPDSLIDEELRYHIERQIEQNIAAGMSPADARQSAIREFGNATHAFEDCHRTSFLQPVETAWNDLWHGCRLMLSNRGFAFAAIATIALGIAATTSIFSVVYTVLLKPLPYPEHERLMNIWQLDSKTGARHHVAAADYRDWRERSKSFESIALVRDIGNFNLTGSGEPERLSGARVTANLLDVLRVQPVLGRGFQPGEDSDGRYQVVILSHSLWQRRFASDPSVLGRSITLNNESYVVIGVMSPDFRYPTADFALWIPLTINPVEFKDRIPYNYLSVGRLKANIKPAQAQAELNAIAGRVVIQQMREDAARPVESGLLMLLASVGGLLLIACANLSALLLARALNRAKELSIRMALGASRARLVMQSLFELLPVLLTGGAAGVLCSVLILRLLVPSMPPEMPRVEEIGVNGLVLSFAIAVLLFTALTAGVWPALESSKFTLSARGSSFGPASTRARRWLVAAQVAIAMVLLSGSTLLFRSLVAMQSVDPGFRSDRVVSAHLAIPRAKYRTDADIAAFCRRIMVEVSNLPNVESAGMVNRLPLAGGIQVGPLSFEGTVARPQDLSHFDWRSVAPGYFKTMSIPLIAGRDFAESDTATSQPVGVIDERTAKLAWPNQNPIGRRFQIPYPGVPWVTVIGVVGHIRHNSLTDDGRPQVYWPYMQRAQERMAVVVRTGSSPEQMIAPVIAAVRRVDADQPVYDARVMDEVVGSSLSSMWLNTALLAVFASLALVLTAIGVYGVIAYATAQRSLEFGIRLALGASRSQVASTVLRQGVLLAGAGIAVGLIAALAFSGTLTTLLYQVPARDVKSMLVAASVLAAVALIACLLPALKAARVSPNSALRAE